MHQTPWALAFPTQQPGSILTPFNQAFFRELEISPPSNFGRVSYFYARMLLHATPTRMTGCSEANMANGTIFVLSYIICFGNGIPL